MSPCSPDLQDIPKTALVSNQHSHPPKAFLAQSLVRISRNPASEPDGESPRQLQWGPEPTSKATRESIWGNQLYQPLLANLREQWAYCPRRAQVSGQGGHVAEGGVGVLDLVGSWGCQVLWVRRTLLQNHSPKWTVTQSPVLLWGCRAPVQRPSIEGLISAWP